MNESIYIIEHKSGYAMRVVRQVVDTVQASQLVAALQCGKPDDVLYYGQYSKEEYEAMLEQREGLRLERFDQWCNDNEGAFTESDSVQTMTSGFYGRGEY